MCGVIGCLRTRAMSDCSGIDRQLEICEKCAASNNIGKMRKKTYAVIRHKYAKCYWDNCFSFTSVKKL